jgi:hypothetical protein
MIVNENGWGDKKAPKQEKPEEKVRDIFKIRTQKATEGKENAKQK